MTRVNSKNKGGKFEREVAKIIQRWTGYEFSRVPSSGGLRWKKTDNISGDITCSDPEHAGKFPFSVECKFHKEINFEHILLGNKGCKVLEFWDQATSDAERCNKVPMLIMRYNGMPKGEAFVMFDKDVSDIVLKHFKLGKPQMGLQIPDHNMKCTVVYIFMLSDILATVKYKKLSRKITKLIKTKALEDLPF